MMHCATWRPHTQVVVCGMHLFAPACESTTHVCKSCVSYIELAVTTILALSRPNFRTISKFQITLKKGFLQLSLHTEPILFITLLIR